MSPDHVDVLLATAGTAQAQFAIPNTVSLAGVVFHHQMVPLEVDGALNVVSVTSTNALTLTIGAF